MDKFVSKKSIFTPDTNTHTSMHTLHTVTVPKFGIYMYLRFCFSKILILLHSERPKLYTVLVSLSAIGLKQFYFRKCFNNIVHGEETLKLDGGDG